MLAYCAMQIRPRDITIQPMTLSLESFSLKNTADAIALNKSTPALSKVYTMVGSSMPSSAITSALIARAETSAVSRRKVSESFVCLNAASVFFFSLTMSCTRDITAAPIKVITTISSFSLTLVSSCCALSNTP